jgi:hypothetical protein
MLHCTPSQLQLKKEGRLVDIFHMRAAGHMPVTHEKHESQTAPCYRAVRSDERNSSHKGPMNFISNIRHLFIHLGLLAVVPALALSQVSLVHVTSCGPGPFPGTVCAIPSTASGNLIVVGWQTGVGSMSTTITTVTDNAGNNYSEAGTARSINAANGTVADIWYAANVSAATSITITPSASVTDSGAVIWEFSGADATAPLDQTAVLNSQLAGTTTSGAAVTTTAAGEAVVSLALVYSALTGILSGNPFTNDSTLFSNGWAHFITPSAGTYAAQWIGPAGTYCSSTASFKPARLVKAALNACDLNADGVVNIADVQDAINMALGTSPCAADLMGVGVCDVVVVQRVITAALGGSCVVGTPHSVALGWSASNSTNVAGYNLYRGGVSGGPYTKVNSVLLGVAYSDDTVLSGQTYYYVATAVDSSNNESAYSNEAQAVVPSP